MTKTERLFKLNIKYLRIKNKYSCYKVAREIHIDYSYYYRLENLEKHQNPGYEIYEKIANFYKIEPYELFTELTKKP